MYGGPIQTHNHPKKRSINRPLEKFCIFETNKIHVGKLRVLVKMEKVQYPWTASSGGRVHSLYQFNDYPSPDQPACLSILSSIIMRVTLVILDFIAGGL